MHRIQIMIRAVEFSRCFRRYKVVKLVVFFSLIIVDLEYKIVAYNFDSASEKMAFVDSTQFSALQYLN
jgi:hypothetical protein